MTTDRYFFIFGSGSPLARYYVEIIAEDEIHARAKMTCWFSGHWVRLYTFAAFQGQSEKYHLERLNVNEDATLRLCTNYPATGKAYPRNGP